MSSAKPGGNGSKDGVVAKTAGVAILCGVAWSVYKTVKPLLCKPKYTTYHIERGDTLYSIAHRNGVSVHNLKVANGYDDDDIYAGDVMSIPK
ncbi:hypothetical protein GOP47_0007171 [Adiantum capillus-veneris]|uniref:LysM domain-containing protein n=1 Tax=Adiantum capillus-veneris TaxID=13818 RepID=A0A9D4ZKN0_ADICA|nr:hypothetical protein GOP47_0007171 [Adiantum capillus-veneris]